MIAALRQAGVFFPADPMLLVNLGILVCAVVASVSAWRSSRQATRAAADARAGARATVLSELLKDYDSPDMHSAMAHLDDYQLRHGVSFPTRFKEQIDREPGTVTRENGARRKVSTYFDNVLAMYKLGMLGSKELNLCMTKDRVQFYRDVIEPLEAALNLGYNREPFEWFGERYGIERSFLVSSMEDWAKQENQTESGDN